MAALVALIRWLMLKLTRYYIVEFDIDGKGEKYPALHNVQHYGGCPDTGIFTSHKQALAYWDYRTADCHDPGFRYKITRLPSTDAQVADFISKGK